MRHIEHCVLQNAKDLCQEIGFCLLLNTVVFKLTLGAFMFHLSKCNLRHFPEAIKLHLRGSIESLSALFVFESNLDHLLVHVRFFLYIPVQLIAFQ